MLSYYDHILNSLQKGNTEEDIVRQFTKDLNAARDDFHGKAFYDEAMRGFKVAWNDAIDAYAYYKGLDEGVTTKELYLKDNDDPIETIISTYNLIRNIKDTLKNVAAADANGFKP